MSWIKQFPRERNKISVEAQISLWSELCGKWKDSKSKGQTIKEIYDTRSSGREISL